MGYIKKPEPADDVVIAEAIPGVAPVFTWGDHRRMQKLLEEAEADNPGLAAARASLDEAITKAGFNLDDEELICQWCWQPMSEPHDVDCRDYNDPALWVKREASGYQYLSDKFVVVHTTSVPMNDEEALEYFSVVQLMFPAHPDLWVRYITRRAIGDNAFQMMPFQYNKDVNEVFPIVRPGG